MCRNLMMSRPSVRTARHGYHFDPGGCSNAASTARCGSRYGVIVQIAAGVIAAELSQKYERGYR